MFKQNNSVHVSPEGLSFSGAFANFKYVKVDISLAMEKVRKIRLDMNTPISLSGQNVSLRILPMQKVHFPRFSLAEICQEGPNLRVDRNGFLLALLYKEGIDLLAEGEVVVELPENPVSSWYAPDTLYAWKASREEGADEIVLDLIDMESYPESHWKFLVA